MKRLNSTDFQAWCEYSRYQLRNWIPGLASAKRELHVDRSSSVQDWLS